MSNNRSTGSGSRGPNSRGYHPPPPAFPFYSPPNNNHRGRAAPLYRSTSFPSGPTGHQGSSTHVVTTPPPTPRASSSSLDTYHSYYYDVEERAERRRVLQSFKCPFNEDGIVCKHNDNPEYCMFAHEEADVGLGWPISGSNDKVGNLDGNEENELKEIPPYVCIFSLLNSCRNRNSHSQSSTRSKFVDGPTGTGATGTSATGSCMTGCSTTVTSTNGNFIGNYTSGSNNIESSIAKSTPTGNITTGNSSPGSSFIGNCSPGGSVARNGITESSFIGNGTTESTTTGNGTTGNSTAGNSSNGSSVNRNGTKENSFIGNGTIGSSSTESTTTGNSSPGSSFIGNSSPGSSVTRNGFKGSTFIRNDTIESSFIENCTIEGSSTESTTNGSKVPEVATAGPSTDVVLGATKKKKVEVCSSGVHVQLEDMADLDRFERENGDVIDKFYGPDKDRECCVCFDKVTSKRFAKNRKFALLESCAHVFCVCCIREWCSRSNRCPVCRVVSVRYVVRGRWIEDEESKRLFFADKRNLNCMFATTNEVATRGRNHRPIRIRGEIWAVAEGNERQAFNALHNLQVLEAEAEELLRYFNLFEFQNPGNMDPFGIGDGDVNELGNFPDVPLVPPESVPAPEQLNPNLHYHPHDFMFRLPDHLVGEGFEPIYFTRSTLQALVDNRRRNGPSAAGENSTAPRTVAEVHHVNRNILRRLGYWLPDETTVGIGASAGGADNVSRTGSNVWNSPGRLASIGGGSARVGSAAGNVGSASGNVGNASAGIRSASAIGGGSSGRVGSATARVGCASGNVVPSRPVEPLVNLISGNVAENISGLVDGSNPAPLVYGVTHMARGQSNEAIVNAILATMGVHFHEATTTGSGSASPSPPPLPFGAPPPVHAHADADGHGHTHHSWDCPTCVHRQYGGTFSGASRALNRSPYVSGTIPEDDDADDEASPGSEQDIASSRNGASNGTRRSRGSALMRSYGEAVRKYGH